MIAQFGLKNFYQRKLQEVNGISMEAVLPESSNGKKVITLLDETWCDQILSKKAWSTENVSFENITFPF